MRLKNKYLRCPGERNGRHPRRELALGTIASAGPLGILVVADSLVIASINSRLSISMLREDPRHLPRERDGVYRGMWPFVAMHVLGLILCIAFPEIVLWLARITGLLEACDVCRWNLLVLKNAY